MPDRSRSSSRGWSGKRIPSRGCTMSDISTKAGARRPRTLAECRAELAHKRDTLIANIKAAEAGPRGGGRSRGVQLDTPQKSTPWLSWGNGTYVDADYPLRRLRWRVLQLRIQHCLARAYLQV